MRVAAVLVAAFAAVAQAFVVPSSAPVSRTRGVMQMLKVRRRDLDGDRRVRVWRVVVLAIGTQSRTGGGGSWLDGM